MRVPNRDTTFATRIAERRKRAEFERQKRVEEDAAWAKHLATARGLASEFRKDWLAEHLVRQKRRCAYCGVIMTDATDINAPDRRASIDHVVPRSAGGSDTRENTVAACVFCNGCKGNMSADEWLAHPTRRARLEKALRPPDRLSNDPASPYYNKIALDRGVQIRFNGNEIRNVHEYCVSEGWIRVRFGHSYDRNGDPLTRKLFGSVDPSFSDLESALSEINVLLAERLR